MNIKKIDWALLRRQKALVYELAHDEKMLGKEEREAMEGLLHFLDSTMDDAAKVLGEKKVFGDPNKGDSCLDGLACPSCGQTEKFKIEAETTATVVADGVEDHQDVTWNAFSHITCPDCGQSGKLWQFAK